MANTNYHIVCVTSFFLSYQYAFMSDLHNRQMSEAGTDNEYPCIYTGWSKK